MIWPGCCRTAVGSTEFSQTLSPEQVESEVKRSQAMFLSQLKVSRLVVESLHWKLDFGGFLQSFSSGIKRHIRRRWANSLPPQLMGTDGSEQMYGDGCVFKDADSSSVPAMCVAASPLPFHVSEFAPGCAFADRSIQWKVQPKRVAPRLRRRVFLSSRGERTHVYTSGCQSLTFELILDLSPPPPEAG